MRHSPPFPRPSYTRSANPGSARRMSVGARRAAPRGRPGRCVDTEAGPDAVTPISRAQLAPKSTCRVHNALSARRPPPELIIERCNEALVEQIGQREGRGRMRFRCRERSRWVGSVERALPRRECRLTPASRQAQQAEQEQSEAASAGEQRQSSARGRRRVLQTPIAIQQVVRRRHAAANDEREGNSNDLGRSGAAGHAGALSTWAVKYGGARKDIHSEGNEIGQLGIGREAEIKRAAAAARTRAPQHHVLRA